MNEEKKLLEYSDTICNFLKDYLANSKLKGYVLGVSGGIDSCLVALLLKKAKVQFKCVLLPCGKVNDDLEIAQRFCEKESFDYDIIDIENVHSLMKKELASNGLLIHKDNAGNIKARLRMTYLYSYAQHHSFLVAGTDNYVEYMLGYFTKYGDGGVDVLPILHLLKGEVYQMARLLGAPKEILERTPSAGFYEGHEDEKELGFSYETADKYFSGGKVDPLTKEKIERWIRISQHKRDPLPNPTPFLRGKNE